MAGKQLKYQFHNANPLDTTADTLMKVLLEANTEKARGVIQEAVKILYNDGAKSGAGYPV